MTDLVLGGAQIGQAYGVARTGSFQDQIEVNELLDVAWNVGFCAVDTARGYGQSERRIGKSKWHGEIHTKIDHAIDPLASVSTSLALVNRQLIDVLYLSHDLSKLPDNAASTLKTLVKSLAGQVKQFGLSLYADQLTDPLTRREEFKVLQVPMSILTGRLPNAIVREWNQEGKTIVARSVFAQGLLLGSQSRVKNPKLSRAVVAIERISSNLEVSPAELAFRYILSSDQIDRIVVGVSRLGELHQISHWAHKGPLSGEEISFAEKELFPFRFSLDLRKIS